MIVGHVFDFIGKKIMLLEKACDLKTILQDSSICTSVSNTLKLYDKAKQNKKRAKILD
jgi:hypothetical protein